MEISEILSYEKVREFCGFQIQQGMNYSIPNGFNVFLMSARKDSPYTDSISNDGSRIIYEGHDEVRSKENSNPKALDQPRFNKKGTLTSNGKFEREAIKYKETGIHPCKIIVFNKLNKGLWTFQGVFSLIDVKYVKVGMRKVFKFTLELTETNPKTNKVVDLRHDRIIPREIQVAVYKRDGGRCVQCGSKDNLHFDHIVPYSKGGSSKIEKNIQILCARHNLSKGNRF
jgi:hypothetical protein